MMSTRRRNPSQRYLLVLPVVGLVAVSLSAHAGGFYGDPPDANHPWGVHDMNRPQPPRVDPATIVGGAPSDAVVLFDGTEASLENWVHLTPDEKRRKNWIVQDGAMQCVPGCGYIATRQEFGDCQVHVEWMAPKGLPGSGQGRGNSGIFLPGGIEVQVLDNYQNPTYPDGTAGSVYGIMPPAANALRAPGEWQSYDIIYRRPVAKNGKVVDQGTMTVLMNGVVVQDGTPLEGGGGHRSRSNPARVFPEKGHIKIQDHGNPVRFRNIWVRALRPRPIDGGTDGKLPEAAATAKRAEIAESIRADAAKLERMGKALRLLESLKYAANEAAWSEADAFVSVYVKDLAGMTPDARNTKRGDITNLNNALKYLTRFNLIPAAYPPFAELQKIMDAQGWKR
jgi:hypothetical protein